jgi:hypothetical protein
MKDDIIVTLENIINGYVFSMETRTTFECIEREIHDAFMCYIYFLEFVNIEIQRIRYREGTIFVSYTNDIDDEKSVVLSKFVNEVFDTARVRSYIIYNIIK